MEIMFQNNSKGQFLVFCSLNHCQVHSMPTLNYGRTLVNVDELILSHSWRRPDWVDGGVQCSEFVTLASSKVEPKQVLVQFMQETPDSDRSMSVSMVIKNLLVKWASGDRWLEQPQCSQDAAR
jgi:hypothetical protein